MATGKALDGKPYAGNPHVRFDEGEVAPAATPRRGSLLYKKLMMACVAAVAAATGLGETYRLDHGRLSDAEAGAALVEKVGACGQGDEIVLGKGRWLLGGTTIRLAKEMKLTGETDNPRDVVIDGDGKSACITVPDGADNVTISSLTASNGLVTVATETDKRGGGIYSLGKNLLVTNCVVTYCQGSFDGSEKPDGFNYIYGVGICSMGEGSEIVDSLVENNRAYLTQVINTRDFNYGVGIYVSLGTVRKCVVRNNWFVQKVSESGLMQFAVAGLGVYTGNATVDSCAIYGNVATNEVDDVQNLGTINNSDGGGVYLSNSAGVLTNSYVTENRACRGAGVFVSAGNCHIENCDLVRNSGNGAQYSKGGNLCVVGTGCKVFGTRLEEGYALDAPSAYVYGAGACFSNCIVRGNTTSSPFWVLGDHLTNTHSLVCNNAVEYFYAKGGLGLTVTDCVFSNNVQRLNYTGFANMDTTINTDAQVKRVRNCLFVGNTLEGGTGRGEMKGTAPVQFVWESCTFVSNAMANSLYRFSGDGLCKTGEGPQLATCLITRNCLFWKNHTGNGRNAATIINDNFSDSPNSVSNNFIYGANADYVTKANGNIIDVEDPGFVDAANGDYRIARNGAVRDKASLSDWMGDGSRKSPRDLGKGFDVKDGVVTFTACGETHTVGCNLVKIGACPRLYGNAPDIGCCEYFCPPGLMLLLR